MTNSPMLDSFMPLTPNENRYVETLLQGAYLAGVLSDSDAIRMQDKLLAFIELYATRYVGGMSTSLPVETVQSLAASAIYQLSFALRARQNANRALEALKSKPLLDLQKEGRDQIKTYTAKSRERLALLQKSRVKIPHQAYHDTLMKGLPLFFASYDVEYAAHDTPGSIDYQLAVEIENVTGISMIAAYLDQLEIENKFCRLFAPNDLYRLMKSFDANYEVLLENLFQHAWRNAIGRILTHQDPKNLTLTFQDVETIQNTLAFLSGQDLKKTLSLSADTLIQGLSIHHPPLVALIHQTVESEEIRIALALKHGSTDKFWIPSL